MDYYRVLGLNKGATKSEIKDAFRKLAIKFHPDKHNASSKSVKDSATLRFKQVSEAYDVLSDDRKRADYNLRHSGSAYTTCSSSSYTNNNGHRSGYGYSSNNKTGYGYGYGYSSRTPSNNGFAFQFDKFARYLTTRDFLLHATFIGPSNSVGGVAAALKYKDFAHYLTKFTTRDFFQGAAFFCIILGGTVIIDKGRGLVWNLQNSGKSFEAAMDNIQKAKADKDKE